MRDRAYTKLVEEYFLVKVSTHALLSWAKPSYWNNKEKQEISFSITQHVNEWNSREKVLSKFMNTLKERNMNVLWKRETLLAHAHEESLVRIMSEVKEGKPWEKRSDKGGDLRGDSWPHTACQRTRRASLSLSRALKLQLSLPSS